VEITPVLVDDTGPTVDDRSPAATNGPWTDGGQVVDEPRAPWKHNDVVRSAGEKRRGRPQELHGSRTAADLRRNRVVHSFHTPYYGDAIYLRTPLLQYGVWVTTREERP
jgi:hypothetical protein